MSVNCAPVFWVRGRPHLPKSKPNYSSDTKPSKYAFNLLCVSPVYPHNTTLLANMLLNNQHSLSGFLRGYIGSLLLHTLPLFFTPITVSVTVSSIFPSFLLSFLPPSLPLLRMFVSFFRIYLRHSFSVLLALTSFQFLFWSVCDFLLPSFIFSLLLFFFLWVYFFLGSLPFFLSSFLSTLLFVYYLLRVCFFFPPSLSILSFFLYFSLIFSYLSPCLFLFPSVCLFLLSFLFLISSFSLLLCSFPSLFEFKAPSVTALSATRSGGCASAILCPLSETRGRVARK